VSRIEEFITMINQLHQHNIGVIIDVVYNHIYNENILELVAPGCYLRRKSWGDISHDTGAGATIESRINMVRELIIHSLKILQNYGVNGFRFDLLSFLDHKTIRTIRKELGDDTILYGEGWNFTDLPPEQAITKYHFPHEIKLGLFNDSARDAFIGHKLDHGIVQGNFTQNLKAKSALVAGSMLYQHDYNEDGRDDIILGHDPYNFFTRAPEECINFLDIHDGLTLWDKINLTVDGPLLKKEQFFKQALSLLLGSQGRIVLHGGVELQRSKPVYSHDKEKHRSFTTKCLLPETPGPFHENSYCSIDATNAIRWENRGSKIWEFTRQLIKLRRNVSQTHLNTIDEINQGFRFIERTPPPARHNIHNFNELPSLSIKFINGPKNEILYITGEVFPETDENPIDNPYKIVFDDKGTGKITFDKTDIQNFDLDQWGFDHDLQIKLIHTPGTWDYYKPSYSPLGYNLISLYTIDATYSVTIDLSIKDYHAILEFLQEPSLLVYTLAKPNSNPSLMIHNLSSNCREILVEAKKRTPEIINIFNDQKIPSPVEIKGHHSMIFQIDHPISELYIKILKENPCSME
jgi:pullulanase